MTSLKLGRKSRRTSRFSARRNRGIELRAERRAGQLLAEMKLIGARVESNLQKAQIPPEPSGFGPIYRGPIREAPGLHPYRPTRWRDGAMRIDPVL